MVLDSVGLNSGGRYKCEVLTESPGFHTADKSQQMIVVGKYINGSVNWRPPSLSKLTPY